MIYADLLKDPRWQKRRLEVFERDHWKCQLCEDNESTLAVHHLRYARKPWDAPDADLLTVCEMCHSWIEYTKHMARDTGRRISGEAITATVTRAKQKAAQAGVRTPFEFGFAVWLELRSNVLAN